MIVDSMLEDATCGFAGTLAELCVDITGFTKKGFVLSADETMIAQDVLVERLCKI